VPVVTKKFNYIPPKNGYPEWNNNPDIFQVNRMEAHTTLMPFDSVEEALQGQRSHSKHFISLNGEWKFSFAKTPEERIKNFYEKEYDCSDWKEIKVPGHWQLQGYDYPQYTNVNYPWENTEPLCQPFAPVVYNPVGSYIRSFEVPVNWDGYPVYISFQGVESAFYLWINGELVGYSEDTFTPAEFDITPYLINGENKLAVEVYRWCDASWLEDQDFWRLSGIFRDVYLYSTPHAHIYDFSVITDLDDTYENADLKLKATVTNYDEKALGKVTVEAELYDPSGRKVLPNPVIMEGCFEHNYSLVLSGAAFVKKPFLWSAEHPYLYTLVFSLKNDDGTLIETESCKVGFRKFELKDGIMKINGKRIVFKGVNRHEFSAESGRAIGREEMLADIILMKSFNINAVRTSHYPNNVIWYELCDEYGIYLIDETNLETHGSWAQHAKEQEKIVPGSMKEWTGAVIDRCNSMLQRDKNHPSVVIWSLGNESYGGDNFIKMHDYLKEQDPTRVIHYEGVCNSKPWRAASDIESHMYAKVEELEAYAQSNPKEPYILCEYSHAMGNSCGNLFKYCDLFDKYEVLQGGFIWDWIDQAIRTQTPEGIEYLAYGGDFNEPRHDGNFCGNGIIFADRTVTPKIYEVKKCYQNIKYEAVDLSTGKIRIYNKFLFTNLKEYEIVWEIMKNGVSVLSGSKLMETEPEKSAEIELGYQLPVMVEENEEYILTVSARTLQDNSWAKQGHEIAFDQFILPVPVTKVMFSTQQRDNLKLREEEGTLTISGDNFIISFHKESGAISSYIYKETQLINNVHPNFWRAYTDNDRGNNLPERCRVWREASQERKLLSMNLNKTEGWVEIEVTYLLEAAANSICKVTYCISDDGEVKIHYLLMPGENLPELPEVGMLYDMDKCFNNLSWYGKGPHENYWDKAGGAKIGIYQGKVDDQMVPYLRPQECGNKTEVRWAKIMNESGIGLRIKGIPFVELNALGYTPFELEAYDHQYKLPAIEKTVLRVNYRQMGVGGDDTWGAKTHPEFTLYANRVYEYSYSIKGTDSTDV
jgi:beta-galactosidase